MGGGGSSSSSNQSNKLSFQGGSAASNFKPEAFNKQLGGDIERLYEQGPGDVYDKSLYTGLGDTTQGAMTGMLDAAQQNQGYMDNSMQYAQGLLDTGPSLTEQSLLDVAQGNRMGTSAPGYAAMRGQLQDDVLSGVGSQFANMGRFGGGSHVETTTDQLTQSLGALDYQNYQNDLARQERALAAIEGQRQQGVSNAMGAAAALPGMYEASLAPQQTQMRVGAMQDADRMAQRQADYELFQRTANPEYRHIAQYLGLLGQQGQNPQPEKKPGVLDWVGTIGTIGAGLL